MTFNPHNMSLDYTALGRRPSAKMIVSDWKKIGRPKEFTAEYGETFAHFILYPGAPRWDADGNGCAGIKRDSVLSLLDKETL